MEETGQTCATYLMHYWNCHLSVRQILFVVMFLLEWLIRDKNLLKFLCCSLVHTRLLLVSTHLFLICFKLCYRLIHVPACILAGIVGLIVEIPLYVAIAIVKSPYMLFKGWQRLIHDLISREGPFLETACIPIAGLTILMWPLVVIGSIIMAVFSSFFIGLYASVVVYQVYFPAILL